MTAIQAARARHRPRRDQMRRQRTPRRDGRDRTAQYRVVTEGQAIRARKRAERAAQVRQERRETLTALAALALIIALLAAVGTMDYQIEQQEIAYWQERGVSIQRW